MKIRKKIINEIVFIRKWKTSICKNLFKYHLESFFIFLHRRLLLMMNLKLSQLKGIVLKMSSIKSYRFQCFKINPVFSRFLEISLTTINFDLLCLHKGSWYNKIHVCFKIEHVKRYPIKIEWLSSEDWQNVNKLLVVENFRIISLKQWCPTGVS